MEQQEKKPRYLTAQQVADELQVKVRTVENWRSRAIPYGPPFTHVGGYVRYPAKAFQAWCDENDLKALQ